jgi:hypothetical protein
MITLLQRIAAAAVLIGAGFLGGGSAPAASAAPTTPVIPHCLVEDGGPQPVCIWDSAVDGNRQPAAPNNVVILYVSRPGDDPAAYRLK